MTLLQSLNGGRNDTPNSVPVCQTVLGAPVDTAGLPTFLPASTGAGVLVLTTQNITADAPMVATAAIGFDGHGEANAVGIIDTQLSWTCTNTATNYLPVLISNGNITAQPITILPIIYQWGGTPATTNTQYTYNIQERKMYLGDGTSANQVSHVIVGEAVAAGGNITSTVAYALQGRFSGAYTATIPTSANASSNHNIGTDLVQPYWIAECTTAENGYSIGDDNMHIVIDQAAGTRANTGLPYFTKYVVGMAFTGTCYMNNKSTGVVAAITNANWKWKFVVQRIF